MYTWRHPDDSIDNSPNHVTRQIQGHVQGAGAMPGAVKLHRLPTKRDHHGSIHSGVSLASVWRVQDVSVVLAMPVCTYRSPWVPLATLLPHLIQRALRGNESHAPSYHLRSQSTSVQCDFVQHTIVSPDPVQLRSNAASWQCSFVAVQLRGNAAS